MKRFSLKLVTPADPQFDQVCATEKKVFLRAFNNSSELMDREYGHYRAASQFLAVFDNKNGRVAGFIRLIRHSDRGLKSLRDLESAPWGGRSVEQILEHTGLQLEQHRVVDIATLGVDVGYRAKDGQVKGALVSAALYHGLVRYSLEHNIAHWVAVLDDKVLAMIQGLGANFQPYVGISSARYLDSPASTPVWAHVPTTLAGLSPLHHHLFVKGRGLKTIVDTTTSFAPHP